ncbi:PAP2 superfamily protein [Burkholderia sp. D7]|nr:PAP2 superfamily protein [Burkholderia sp. D7]
MWTAISNVGDAALTLPVALTCAIWLRLSDKTLAVRWVMLLAAGMALVGITKILYAGCGVEISAIGFRVISGHTTLSTAVWTVAIALLWRSAGGSAWMGAMAGLLIGVLTAFARVFDYAHTVPEVIAGWLLGAVIAALFVHPLARSKVKLFRPIAAAAGLLLVTTVAYGHHAPIQAMIDNYSPGVCSRLWAGISALL